MKRCTVCGKIEEDSSAVCSVCGSELAVVPGPGEADSELSDKKPEEGLKRKDGNPEALMAQQLEQMLQASLKSGGADGTDDVKDLEEDLEKALQLNAADLFPEDGDDRKDLPLPEVQETGSGGSAAGEEQEEAAGDEVTSSAEGEASAAQEGDVQKAPKERAPRQAHQGERQAHRIKSEPHIYGQSQMSAITETYEGQQGMVRRNIQGRSSSVRGAQGQPGNEGAQAGRGQSRPTPRDAQGRPMRDAQGRPMQGQPMRDAQGRPMQGQPMRDAQGRPMQGRPMNAMPGQQPNYPMGRPAGSAARLAGQIRETARSAMKSPVFLLIALLETVFLAGSVASVFMNELNYLQFAKIFTAAELPSQVAGYADSFVKLLTRLDNGAVVFNLVLKVPELLFCIGLWLIFFTALAAKERMSGAGFLLVRIVVIIRMIRNCLIMLACLILSVVLVVGAWASGTRSMLVMAAVIIVLMMIITMMVIMYHFCYLSMLSALRKNADTGESYGKASGYVAFIYIIMALTGVVGLLSGIVNFEISSIVSSAGKIGWMVLFAVWIFGYKRKMRELED